MFNFAEEIKFKLSSRSIVTKYKNIEERNVRFVFEQGELYCLGKVTIYFFLPSLEVLCYTSACRFHFFVGFLSSQVWPC